VRLNPERNRQGERVRSTKPDDELIRRHAGIARGSYRERRAAREAARNVLIGFHPKFQAESQRLRVYVRDWEQAIKDDALLLSK
jgi:hypothetical protein